MSATGSNTPNIFRAQYRVYIRPNDLEREYKPFESSDGNITHSSHTRFGLVVSTHKSCILLHDRIHQDSDIGDVLYVTARYKYLTLLSETMVKKFCVGS